MGICYKIIQEKEIAIEVKFKDGELDIKNESILEEENMEKNNNFNEIIEQSNFKGPQTIKISQNSLEKFKNELRNPKLQKEFSINFDDNTDIYDVQELSNKRIISNRTKIYSLKTGKLINEISHNKCENNLKELKNNDFVTYSSRKIYIYKLAKNNNYELYQTIQIIEENKYDELIDGIIELKNNDLLIYSSRKIYIYKLAKNNNYELYQTIDEYKQGTFKKKEKPQEEWCEGNDHFTESYKINSIYELMNGNLISCNSYGIKIYKKNKEGKYELFITKKIKTEVHHVIEIKSNIIIIFCKEVKHISYTFLYFVFDVYKYNIEKDELTELYGERFNDRHLMDSILHFSYLINNNLLFIRFGFKLEIYDINEEKSLVLENKEDYRLIKEFCCNYDSNTFIAKNRDNKYKIFCYKDNKLYDLGEFPLSNENTKGIIKLQDNNFIIYSVREIILLKILVE